MVGVVLFQLDKNILSWLPSTRSKKAGSYSSSGADVVDVCGGRSVGSNGSVEWGTDESREAVRSSDDKRLARDESGDGEEGDLDKVERRNSPAGEESGDSHQDQMESQD